ncbi:hypothetical protein [Heyndrickxia coagulans]|uniref:hypothetical protein n=1 Tax=Heyndrickxia coagulans TaxID=1398 RepID=UPI002E03C7DD|nr:hypothetical protein [Heyndrickxia coagulans]MED4936022.1 hypothetical protein [Heyndrickxia coagulans]MED4965080.1 hypothetical protein [Heyndrickxia coagulans]MED4967400.1 hypothetical protein [Heyndrickxia coagulans]
MHYSFQISTFGKYNNEKHEYETIEQVIYEVLSLLKKSNFAMYQYTISISNDALESPLITIPLQGKTRFLFSRKKCIICEANDASFYRDRVVSNDKLFFIEKDKSIDQIFKDKILTEENFKSDLLNIVPLTVEIYESEEITMTSAVKEQIVFIAENLF